MRILSLILAFTASAAAPDSRLPPGENVSEYHVGAQDRLQISVWREEELTGTFDVNARGSIHYPLLGDVPVAGKTTQEIDDLLTGKLGDDYLVDPIVSVSVAGYRSQKVYVFGAVKKPGLFFLDDDPSILKIILDAGGPDGTSSLTGDVVRLGEAPGKDGQPVEIRRVDLTALFTRGDFSQNLQLRTGDIIFVRSGGRESLKGGDVVYITGAVKNPGAYAWSDDSTVLNIVLQAGGTTEFASGNRTRVIRGQGPEREIFHVRVDDILKGDKDKNLKLQPGDLITVPESFF